MKVSDWQTWGWKKPLWRKIRDVFDNTEYVSYGKKLVKQKEKQYQQILKKQDEKINQQEEQKFVPIKQVEDYIASNENKINIIPTIAPYIIQIPFRFPKFKIERNGRKIIKINIDKYLPKLKFKIINLKRLAYLSTTTCCIIVVFVSSFLFYRGLNLLEGDYLGEVYAYKVSKFEIETLAPLVNLLQDMNTRVNNLEAKKDFEDFKKLTNYKPPIKKEYKFYNKKGELVEVKYQ
jgi:hypothetical protein